MAISECCIRLQSFLRTPISSQRAQIFPPSAFVPPPFSIREESVDIETFFLSPDDVRMVAGRSEWEAKEGKKKKEEVVEFQTNLPFISTPFLSTSLSSASFIALRF